MAQRDAIDTLSKACAYGDFDKLRQFIDQDPASVNQPDENGYFPLQWAALNNRVPESTYLLQVCGCSLPSMALPSRVGVGRQGSGEAGRCLQQHPCQHTSTALA